jgi:hypothetical protein
LAQILAIFQENIVIPTAEQIAAAILAAAQVSPIHSDVRAELAPELARIDKAISSRASLADLLAVV